METLNADFSRKDRGILNTAIRMLRATLAVDRATVAQIRRAVKILDRIEITTAQFASAVRTLLNIPKNRLAKKGTDEKAIKLADTMVRSAAKEMKIATEWYDPSMYAMSLGDAADYLEIACLLYEGKVSQAEAKGHDLDTESRDDIPVTVGE